MTKNNVRRVTYWTILCVAALAMTGTMTGCRTWAKLSPFKKSNQPPLLNDRGLVPPAYGDPADVSDRMVPVEPKLDMQPDMGTTDLPPLDTPPDLGTIDMTGSGTPVTTPVIALPPVVQSSTLTYKVQKGDSFWKIGRAYGVTFQELAAFNNLDPKAVLKAGSTLLIPPGGKFVPESERPPVKSIHPTIQGNTSTGTPHTLKSRKADANGIYTVKPGDNLWLIAKSFKTKVSALRSLNNLTTDTLQVGDKLKIPGLTAGAVNPVVPPATSGPEPTGTDSGISGGTTEPSTVTDGGPDSTPAATTTGGTELPSMLEYTIGENDTLKGIADMYNVKVQAIVDANAGIKTDADLLPGKNIRIPFN